MASFNFCHLWKRLGNLPYLHAAQTQDETQLLHLITRFGRSWCWSLLFPRSSYLQVSSFDLLPQRRRRFRSVNDLFLDYQPLYDDFRSLFSYCEATCLHDLVNKEKYFILDRIIVACSIGGLLCSVSLHKSQWMPHKPEGHCRRLDIHV